jgi:hypothetical protein
VLTARCSTGSAELEAIRGDKTKATEVLAVIVRQHGHRR